MKLGPRIAAASGPNFMINAEERGTGDGGRSGGFGDGAVDPGHHAAQLAAGLIDRVVLALLAELGEVRSVRVVLRGPLARELAAMDLAENLPHLVLDPLVDDARRSEE